MSIKVFPVKFEAYDTETNDSVFSVEAFDESWDMVKIEVPVNVELWRTISGMIEQCLIDMELGDESSTNKIHQRRTGPT